MSDPGSRPPSHEGLDLLFPVTGERLRTETLDLLKQTIWAPDSVKTQRSTYFDTIWSERWQEHGG
jgi:hypothetical protein